MFLGGGWLDGAEADALQLPTAEGAHLFAPPAAAGGLSQARMQPAFEGALWCRLKVENRSCSPSLCVRVCGDISSAAKRCGSSPEL